MKDKTGIKGKVTAKVFDENKNIKRYPRNLFRRLFNLPGKEMIIENHNIVTNHGDALIVDALSTTPTRTLMDNTNAEIGVGTGYVSALKTVTALVTPNGLYLGMDATYPSQKGAFNAADDNVLVFKTTSEVGDWAGTLNEVALGNGTDLLAYAELSPNAILASTDTLEITWEITLLGA